MKSYVRFIWKCSSLCIGHKNDGRQAIELVTHFLAEPENVDWVAIV